MSLKKHIAARRLIGVERGETMAEFCLRWAGQLAADAHSQHMQARRVSDAFGVTLAEAEEAMRKAEVTKVTRTHNELIARALGLADGATVARENEAEGTYRPGQSADWDSGLINAIGLQAVRKLFDLPPTDSPQDDPRFDPCLRAYDAAAREAYDAHGKQSSQAADRALIDAAFAGQWR